MGLAVGLGLAGITGLGVDLADVVGAIRLALAAETLSGPIVVAAPETVTNREFVQTMARELRRPAILPIPSPMLKAALGDFAREALLSSQRVIPRKLLDMAMTSGSPNSLRRFAQPFAGLAAGTAHDPWLPTGIALVLRQFRQPARLRDWATLIARQLRVGIAVLLALALLALPTVGAASAPAGFPLQRGFFYTQTGGGGGLGYAVVDDRDAQFWTAYEELGGHETLGFPNFAALARSAVRLPGLSTGRASGRPRRRNSPNQHLRRAVRRGT